MRQQIERYAFFWNVAANEGHFLFQFADGDTAQALVDTPAEGTLMLDVLRNEKPVYYDVEVSLLMTTMEPVGEEEDD